jgi:hypothetical protein
VRSSALALVVLLGSTAARAQTCTLIAEGTTWLSHADPPPPGWADLGTVDDPELSTWQLACTPFSNTGCGFAPGTYWEPFTTVWLRQHVYLTGAESGMIAYVAIDNDFELYVNGALVGALVHEGCATRWDAAIAVPDAAWVVGDNVVAVHITDRGGITTFETTLLGTTTGKCPAGCAQLPCGEPGPVVVVPDVLDCAGRRLAIPAAAAWARECATDIEIRFRASDGRLLRGWAPLPWAGVQIGDVDGLIVEARCSQSPTCPRGSTTSVVAALPFPPQDPGPTLRVSKVGGLATLTWTSAPALLPGEHDHVTSAARACLQFVRVNGEGEIARTWTDPAPFGRACYLVNVADSCEIVSADAP